MVCSITVAVLWWREFTFPTLVSVLAISLLWLIVYSITADRRLFFPYTMQMAVQIGFLVGGKAARPELFGSGGLIAVFLLIRIVQAASVKVLLVEVVVSAAILLLTLGTLRNRPPHLASAIASLLAYASLAL